MTADILPFHKPDYQRKEHMMKNYGKGSRDNKSSGQAKGSHYRETGQAKYSGGGSTQKDGYKPHKAPKK